MQIPLALVAPLAASSLFVIMVLMIEFGRRLGKRRARRDQEGSRAGLGAVEGAVFGLLGLLVAFTFSGAASRLEIRRSLVVQESNDIGTAWSRLDLLPAPARFSLQQLFRDYLDSRLEIYRRLPDVESAREELARSVALQREIWRQATAACETAEGQRATMLLLPALNAMFDITTTRTMALLNHPPPIIYYMLFAVAAGCSVLAGYGMAGGKQRSWAHQIGFAAVIAASVFVILELEFPRAGLIRVDTADRALTGLRESMN